MLNAEFLGPKSWVPGAVVSQSGDFSDQKSKVQEKTNP